MKYMLGEKVIIIPDGELKNMQKALDLTEEEAIETWLDDNDYTKNEEVEQLTKKAKENKTDKIIGKSDKPRAKREVVKKDDPDKEMLIEVLNNALLGVAAMGKVKITNKTKMIEFEYNGENYKLDLIKTRKKKGE